MSELSPQANLVAEAQPSTEISCLATCPMRALGIHIIPVRYALDEMIEDEAKQNSVPRFGLPDNWQGDGPFAAGLTRSAYTLRQLRDGWLYVLAEDNDNTFHEYEVRGTELIKYNMAEWVQEKGETNRGKPGQKSTFLTYNQNNTLYLAWSKQRWSWRLYNSVLANKTKARQWMRKVPLKQFCNTLCEPHIGQVNQLANSVADIALMESDERLFEGHLTQTAHSEGTEPQDVKPIAAAYNLLDGMEDFSSGIFVALDDPLADLQQLSITLGREVVAYHQLMEEKMHKQALLETAAQVTALNAPEELTYPGSVNTEQQKREYYKKLSDYLELKREYKKYMEQARQSSSIIGMSSVRGRWKKEELDEAKEQLMTDYGEHEVDAQGVFKRWEETKKYRDEMDNSAFLEAMDDFQNHDQPMIDRQTERLNVYRAQLVAAIKTFGWEPEKAFVDNHTTEGQHYLSEVHFFIAESVTQVIDEHTRDWLEQEFTQPKTLLPLYLSGFHKGLYEEIGSGLLPDDTQNDYISNSGNFLSRYNDLNAFLSAESIKKSAFYQNLSHNLQPVMLAFKEATQRTSNATLTGIARVSVSFSMLFSNRNFQNRALIAEQMALGVSLRENKNYRGRMTIWRAKRVELLQELDSLYNQLKIDKVTNNYDGPVKPHGAGSPGSIAALESEIQRLEKRYPTLLSELDELYYAAPAMRTINGEDRVQEVKKTIRAHIHEGQRITKHTFDDLGKFGFIIFLLNALDLFVCYGDLKYNSTPRARAEIIQKMAYSFSSLAAIFQGKAWNSMGKLRSEFLEEKIIVALKDHPEKLARYIKFTRFATTLGVIGVGIELLYTYEDIQQAQSSAEKNWLIAKGGGLALMGASAVLQGGATLIASKVALGFLVGAVVTGLTLVGGVIYLVAVLVLSTLKKDDYQKWLRRLPWGAADKADRFEYTSDGVIEALLSLYQFTMQPKLYLRAEGEIVAHHPDHPKFIFQRHGFTLRVDLPAHLEHHSNLVNIDIRYPKLDPVPEIKYTAGKEALTAVCYIPETSQENVPFTIEVSFFIHAGKNNKLRRTLSYLYSFHSGRVNKETESRRKPGFMLQQPLSSDIAPQQKKLAHYHPYDNDWFRDREWQWWYAELPKKTVIV